MKRYRLSSAVERVAGTLISVILLLCMIFLILVLSGDVLALIICILASLLVAAALGFYVVNLFKVACIPHPENAILEVKGFPDYTISLDETVSLETAAFKNGPLATRTLIFTDASGEISATVPTFFTANQGAQAEPLAMELAQALGLTFKPTLEPWEYDKEKRKEHQWELAQAEKAARKEKLRSLKVKLLRKPEAGEPTSALSEEEMSVADNMEDMGSDGINYDALDDDK